TPGLIAVAADDASVVGSRERAHHELSGLDIPNLFPNLFNDAAVLVSHRGRLRDGLNAAIRPKVRSADTCGREAKDGICRLDDCRLGPILKTNITRAVEHSSLHGRSPYFNCMVHNYRCKPSESALAQCANLLARCAPCRSKEEMLRTHSATAAG